jgi:hypothetical protein
VDNKVVCRPNKTYGTKEEILGDPPKPLKPISCLATQVLNLTQRSIGNDEVLKMKDLEPNYSVIVPDRVPPTSPNGGDDIGMVLQPPSSLLR